MSGIVLLFVFSLALIFGPVAASVAGASLGAFATTIMMVFGIVLCLFSISVLTVTKLYVKTKASEAFVRTGAGGSKVINNGGALVIPVVHQMIVVPLSTTRLVVNRVGADSLITHDKLRADITAEFFVNVKPTNDDIKNAARSFGDEIRPNTSFTSVITEKFQDKLISALRTVAATRTLEQLNSERDTFLKAVIDIVAKDLAPNGLALETVTISKLDQTDPKNLRDDNIFDAQGKRTIAEITQAQQTQRTQLERQGEMARTKLNVEAKQAVLKLEQTQAQAEAAQKAEIAKVQAQQDQATKEAQITTQQAVELAGVGRQKAVEIAMRAQQQAVEVAEQQKQQAVEVAQREREKAVVAAVQSVEVAERQKQQAVAEAEKARATAEADLAEAEAARETQRQAVHTVQVTAEAERAAAKQVIEAKAKAEQAYLSTSRTADANAYATQKDAEARKMAAEAEATAITKRAEADASAKKQQAEGDKAAQMVAVDVERAKVEVQKNAAMIPVDVKAKEVDVDRKRVEDVLKPELQARSDFGQAAQQFELAQLQITKEAEVRIAMANAQATLLGKVNVQVVGSSQDVEKITSAFTSGMSGAKFLDGMFAGAGVDAMAMLKGIGGKLSGLADAATEKLTDTSEDLAVTKPAASPAVPSKTGHADGNNTGSQRS